MADSRNANRICASVLPLQDMCSTLLPLFQVAQWRPSEGNFGTWRRREAPPSGRQAFCQFFARNSQAGTNLPLPQSVRRHLPYVWRHMPDCRDRRHLDFGTNWEDSVVTVIVVSVCKGGRFIISSCGWKRPYLSASWLTPCLAPAHD